MKYEIGTTKTSELLLERCIMIPTAKEHGQPRVLSA
jgi:hypothetical protein